LEDRRRDVLYLHADTFGRTEATPNTVEEADAEAPREPPASEAADADGTGLGDDRDVVSDLARSLEYPIVELDSARWVLPGSRSCRAWESSLATADARGLRETRQCLSYLAERTAGAENR